MQPHRTKALSGKNRSSDWLPDASRLTPLEQRVMQAFVNHLQTFRGADRIRSISVFGSRARGDSHEASDLDVAVFCIGGYDRQLMRLISDAAADAMLEWDALEVGLHPIVLFSHEEARDQALRNTIEAEGITLWHSR